MAEQPEEKPKLESRADQKREDAEAGAIVGATGLGCLGFVTLPWSIVLVGVFIIFVIVWCIHHFALR